MAAQLRFTKLDLNKSQDFWIIRLYSWTVCTPTTVRTNVSNTNQWFINIFLPEFLVFILYMPPSLKPVVLICMPHHPTPFFLFHSLLVSTATASLLQGLPQTAASIHVPSSIIIHRNWGSGPSWWIIIRRTCFGPVCYLQFVTMTGSFACFLLLLLFLHWLPFLMQPTNGFVSSPRFKPGIFCLWD